MKREKLSELVTRRIAELGTSKAAIAAETGLSRTYITDIANGTGSTPTGEYILSPENITKIAKAIKVMPEVVISAMYYKELGDIGYRKPTTPFELFSLFEDLGLDINFNEGVKSLEGLDEDDLQEIVDSAVANASAKIKRKFKEMQAK